MSNRLGVVSLVGGLALGVPPSGCFGEAPRIDLDEASTTGGGTSSDGTSTTDTSGATVMSVSSTGAEGSSSDGSTGSSGPDPDSSSGEVETTSDTPMICECLADALWCENFEPPFVTNAGGWQVPFGGSPPEATNAPTRCGEGALRSAVGARDSYSVITGQLPAGITQPGVHRVTTWVRVDEACLGSATRLMQVRLVGPQGELRYGMEVFADLGTIALGLQGAGPVPTTYPVEQALTTGVWTEVELTFDRSAESVVVSLRVGETTVHDQIVGPAPGLLAPEGATINLGVARGSLPFDGACTVVYDDASAM